MWNATSEAGLDDVTIRHLQPQGILIAESPEPARMFQSRQATPLGSAGRLSYRLGSAGSGIAGTFRRRGALPS
jgi:hypothetical protein